MRTRHPIHNRGASQRDAQRHSGSNAFRDGYDVRLYDCMLNGPPFTGASGATLHLVGHKENSVAIADSAQFGHELRRRRNVATFTLDRLDEDGRTLFRRHDGLEYLVFNEPCALERVL